MSNTINVNYFSGIARTYSNNKSVAIASKKSFSIEDNIREASENMVTDEVNVRGINKLDQDMTMEEYKSQIYDQISSFRIDPSRAHDSYSINISEAGFAAMKEDPEYEAWVLDYIKRDMAVAAPGWYTAMGGPSAYCVLNFGATKEERTGQMVSAGYQNGKGKSIFDSHSKDSFWSKRNDVQKAYNRQIEKKTVARKQQQKKLIEERIRHQLMMESLDRKRLNAEMLARRSTPIATSEVAIESYESSFMVSNANESVFPGDDL